MSGYRLHGVKSFPIRREEFHVSMVPCSSGAQQLNVLCGTTLPSPADAGNPPWSLAVSQAANPDQNYRTGFPRNSTSSTIFGAYGRPRDADRARGLDFHAEGRTSSGQSAELVGVQRVSP